MILLGIDTSTRNVGVAFGSEHGLLASLQISGDGSSSRPRHAEDLVPAIQNLSNELGVSLAEISAVAVGIGPGMFTGLRVGVTTAKTLATALDIPMVAISSLDLIAYPLHGVATSLIVAMTDARRNEVYYAIYEPADGGIRRLSDYALDSPTTVEADLRQRAKQAMLCGDGAQNFATAFEDNALCEFAGSEYNNPSVAALIELAAKRYLRGEVEDAAAVVPMYIRKSDAELSLESKAS